MVVVGGVRGGSLGRGIGDCEILQSYTIKFYNPICENPSNGG